MALYQMAKRRTLLKRQAHCVRTGLKEPWAAVDATFEVRTREDVTARLSARSEVEFFRREVLLHGITHRAFRTNRNDGGLGVFGVEPDRFDVKSLSALLTLSATQ
jgi:hypothetical protein